MTLVPKNSSVSIDKIKKIFKCDVCKNFHNIIFPHNLAENRSKYPFSYVFLHKFQNAETIEDIDKDILTTLYIDAQLNIRGVDNLLIEDDSNILSKEVSREMISKLTHALLELQSEYDRSIENYNELEKKYNEKIKS